MTTLADRIPTMSDSDLASLHANAARLIDHGSPAQMTAANEAMPLIAGEMARRTPSPNPPKPPRKRTSKTTPPAGDQQAVSPAAA